jgi:hypothetical protein
MNIELLSGKPKEPSRSLDECYADKPHVRERLFEISDLIEALVAQGCTAHEAEARAIEQIRKLGHGILTEWGEKSEAAAVAQARAKDPKLQLYRKKEILTWHSTYGEVSVLEQRLRQGRRGAQVRPFCAQAKISARAYSLPLQRAMSDFGADHSFVEASRKVREHYGAILPASSVRKQTLAHAKASGAVEHEPPKRSVATLVTEMDGTMLPIVQTKKGPGLDGRKGKELLWREARLCLARPLDAVDGVYGATFGTVQIAGLLWRQVAEAAGLGGQTRIHGLGDGATWIVQTFQEQFGMSPEGRATYMVDFHHVSDYLVAAAQVVAPAQKRDWLHQQQEQLLHNEVGEVLRSLEPHLEPAEQEEAPIRSAYGYMSQRQQHMDYAGARAAGLPIGSGEVEGGHRHVLQKRLKIAGAWWLEPNAERMLQLRTLRANGDWDKYWTEAAKN